jgi:ATP-dependent Clp protease ATP-binding subunit ClpX
MAKESNKNRICSFCLKTEGEVEILVSGAKGHICETCVGSAMYIIERETGMKYDPQDVMEDADNKSSTNKKAGKGKFVFNLKPIDIYNKLGEYVIGQEAAKKVLSVAIYKTQ